MINMLLNSENVIFTPQASYFQITNFCERRESTEAYYFKRLM